jgi:hypothetical protein
MFTMFAMFNRWIRSLSARLWVTSIVALALTLTVLAMGVTYAFNHYPEQMLGRHDLIQHTKELASGVRFDGAGRPVSLNLPAEQAWLFSAVPTEIHYRVLDEQGHVLFASADAQNGPAWVPGDLAAAVGHIEQVKMDGRSFDITTLELRQGPARFYAQIATSARLLDAMIGTKVRQIPANVRIITSIAAIIFGLTLTVTVHRLLKPLREVSSAAALITPRNLTTRLSLQGMPSEIKPLIEAFNGALGRLENGFAVQQQFLGARTADAAHADPRSDRVAARHRGQGTAASRDRSDGTPDSTTVASGRSQRGTEFHFRRGEYGRCGTRRSGVSRAQGRCEAGQTRARPIGRAGLGVGGPECAVHPAEKHCRKRDQRVTAE